MTNSIIDSILPSASTPAVRPQDSLSNAGGPAFAPVLSRALDADESDEPIADAGALADLESDDAAESIDNDAAATDQGLSGEDDPAEIETAGISNIGEADEVDEDSDDADDDAVQISEAADGAAAAARAGGAEELIAEAEGGAHLTEETIAASAVAAHLRKRATQLLRRASIGPQFQHKNNRPTPLS